jgi:hypothetical protein
MNMQKGLRQDRDLEVYLAENHISEIACSPFSSYILNFQPIRTDLDPRSDLSLSETMIDQEAVVNSYHEM